MTVAEHDPMKSALARIWTKVLAEIRRHGRTTNTARR
jgi:hypothetical protein